MARKFEIRIRQWLPHIIKCIFEYEELNTYEIVKSTGGILRILGNAEEQVGEINAVLDFLTEAKYLIPQKSSQSYYFGINFTNTAYKTIDDPSYPNSEIQEIKLSQNNFTFNFTFAIEKLVELKAGLFNI